jgi:signal transduction histidine kinase
MKLIHKLLLLSLLPLALIIILITTLFYYQNKSIVLSLVQKNVENEINYNVEKIRSFLTPDSVNLK